MHSLVLRGYLWRISSEQLGNSNNGFGKWNLFECDGILIEKLLLIVLAVHITFSHFVILSINTLLSLVIHFTHYSSSITKILSFIFHPNHSPLTLIEIERKGFSLKNMRRHQSLSGLQCYQCFDKLRGKCFISLMCMACYRPLILSAVLVTISQSPSV